MDVWLENPLTSIHDEMSQLNSGFRACTTYSTVSYVHSIARGEETLPIARLLFKTVF